MNKDIFKAAAEWTDRRILSNDTECQRAFIDGAIWALELSADYAANLMWDIKAQCSTKIVNV